MDISSYIDYIKYERKLSSETIKNYKYDLEKFILFLKEKNINSFTDVDKRIIENYLN